MADEDLVAHLRVMGGGAFRSALRGASSDVGGFGRSVGSALPGVRTLMSLGAGFVLADKLRDAASAGFGFNRMIDSQRVGFETLLGSQERAADFMAKIRALALKSPVLDPESTGDAARLLMAYGLAARDTLPFVKALGDMSAATGKSIQETMPRGAMAIGQIASKGKLQSEELNQLAESVGLSRVRIAKELGMTRDEFAATFTPGNNIDASKALPAIMRAMEKQSGGAAERLSKTTAGRMDQLRELLKMKLGAMTRPLWNLGGRLAHGLAKRLADVDPKAVLRKLDVIRNGFAAGLSTGGGGATAGFSGVAGIAATIGGAFHKIGPVIGRALAGAGPMLIKFGKGALAAGKELMGAFAPMVPFLRNVVGPLLLGFGKGVAMGVVAIFKLAVPVIRVFATALGWIGEKLAPLRGVFEGVGEVLGFVFGPSVIGAAVKALRIAASTASGPVAGAFRLIGRGLRPIGSAFKWVGGVIDRFVGGAFTSFTAAASFVFRTVLPSLRRGFKLAFGGLGAIITGAFDGVIGFLERRINNVIDVINGMIGAFNKLPGPNIGKIGRIGGGGDGGKGDGGGGVFGQVGDAAGGRNRREPGNTGTNAGARGFRGFGARPGPTAPARAAGAPLWHLEVPLTVGGRELGRASAVIAARDLKRK